MWKETNVIDELHTTIDIYVKLALHTTNYSLGNNQFLCYWCSPRGGSHTFMLKQCFISKFCTSHFLN